MAGQSNLTKAMKQQAFQFRYDSLNKRFCRELRDPENKEIKYDSLYLQMKRLKESHTAKAAEDPAYRVPEKVASLTYLTYLTRYQRW
jgi:hypothetical protein